MIKRKNALFAHFHGKLAKLKIFHAKCRLLLFNFFFYPRAARWPRSGYTLSIKIFCKNYGSVWRVPSTITALSSDYNSHCHSNSSYATSLATSNSCIHLHCTVSLLYDMYKKGKHRKFNMFDDIFARITIIQVSIAPRNRKQLYTCRTGCCCSRSHRTTISINKRRENRSSANIHQMIQLLCFAVRYNISYFRGIRYCEQLST